MIRLFILISLLSLAFSQKNDRAAVKRAALDYVEAIYESKPELIDRGVDVTVRKYGYWYNPKSKKWRISGEMNFKQLNTLAKNWNAKGNQNTEPKKVEIIDIMEKIAMVKVTASWGIDYMHLGKEAGKWKIINVIWQSPSPSAE